MSCDHDEFQICCSLQKWYVLDMHYLSVLLQVGRGEIFHILSVYTNLVHELNPVLAARDNICPPPFPPMQTTAIVNLELMAWTK